MKKSKTVQQRNMNQGNRVAVNHADTVGLVQEIDILRCVLDNKESHLLLLPIVIFYQTCSSNCIHI